jgi:hypothetical protein
MSIAQNFPEIRPSLNLDFANVKALDSRVTFARASTGAYFDANGLLQTASANVARFDHNPATGESLGSVGGGAEDEFVSALRRI